MPQSSAESQVANTDSLEISVAMPTYHYLMLTSPIEGTPTDGTVLVSDEYRGSLVGLE